jgi:hypothetical protein
MPAPPGFVGNSVPYPFHPATTPLEEEYIKLVQITAYAQISERNRTTAEIEAIANFLCMVDESSDRCADIGGGGLLAN